MRIVDHFQELWAPAFGASRGSIHDYVMPSAYPDEEEIVGYLLNGYDLFSVMGSSDDVLGSGETIMGGDSIYSDCEWVWRGDLWFYVRTHHVALPADFLDGIREVRYKMPPEDLSSLMKIAQELRPHL
ncbi:hypothetical protein ACIP10_01755 [Streptomyces galbus]|uniref:hypothetical protein n=1 Tax=Streptomyces galbus TaxID=33898 RepID=UPI0037B46C2B